MNKKPQRKFHLRQTRWIYAIGIIIVIGSVMSFGAVAYVTGLFDPAGDVDPRRRALAMVWMIAPMTVLYILAMRRVTKKTGERMDRLAGGMEAVREGDLSTEIPLSDAGEFALLYEDFNRMARELDRTKKEMESFTNEFAHEFKTPITSISGFAELLYETGEGIEDEERLLYLQTIAEQAKRLLHLSQNTLLLSKMEALEVVTEQERFDIGEQLRQCVILLKKDAEEKEITVELPEDMTAYFFGNREILHHVWINLLSNAIKFTPRGGTVTIREAHAGGFLQISITDTGLGMDEETVRHIFEKYYQNDAVSPTKGNGIGLSIVKRITELSGGTVTVHSYPGTGSTFTVALPEAPEE